MISGVLVGGGAALGAIARYDTTKWIKQQRASTFPVATLLINWLGALILGVVASHFNTTTGWYALLGIGFCGGFTTFSTLSLETVVLIKQHYYRLAFYYVFATYVGGCILLAGGYWL